MIVNVAFLFGINSEVVGLLDGGFINVGGLAVEVLDFEFHHDFGNVFVDLLDERGDGFCCRVEFVEAAQVMDEFDELIMDFALIFGFFLFLGDFPV